MSNSSYLPRVDARAHPQLGDGSWLTEVAQSACRDVGGVPVELLGDYLPLLADAATSGRRPHPAELDAVGLLGRRAAELGVSAGSAVQLLPVRRPSPVAAAAHGHPVRGESAVRPGGRRGRAPRGV